MTSYIAFLRGINVNGRKVLMQDLQKVFEKLQFTNIKTLIASGNVLFDSSEKDEEKLRTNIEEALEKTFGFFIPVILRTKEDVKKMIDKNPFQEIASPALQDRNDRKGVRLQVTLFVTSVTGDLPIQENGFEIFSLGQRELGSVVYPDGKTTELMTFIDKNFGRNATTRNWNTLQKLIKI